MWSDILCHICTHDCPCFIVKFWQANEVKVATTEEIEAKYRKNAIFATAGTGTLLGLASMVPNAPMMSTFALSCWVGESFLLSQNRRLSLKLNESHICRSPQEIAVCKESPMHFTLH
jgi:hypothetical protein